MAVHFRAKFISLARRVPVVDPVKASLASLNVRTNCGTKLH